MAFRRLEDAVGNAVETGTTMAIENHKKTVVGKILQLLFKKLFAKYLDELLPTIIESVTEAVLGSDEVNVTFKQ